MSDKTGLNQDDLEFIKSMRGSIEEEMDDEFKAELLMDLEQGMDYLRKTRQKGDSRKAADIWSDWEQQKLDIDNIENII